MTLDVTFTSTPSYMGDNAGDDDGTSRTPHILLRALPCTTCSTLPFSVLSCLVCLLGHFLYSRICQSKTAQNELSYTVEKGLFRLNFFDRVFRLGDPVEKLDFFYWICRKTQSKEFFTCFFNPSHRSLSHQQTHTHTPTHPYQVPHSSIIQQCRRCLGYRCFCFSPQVSVVHS